VATSDVAPPRPAALLLTGGRSRRMGRDKAGLVVGGEALGEHTAALLRQVAHPVLEVGPGHTTLTATLEDPPGSGPLVALAAGARALRRLHHQGPTLVVATDLPRLTVAFLQLLAGYPVTGPDDSVVPRDPSLRPQPLCARYSPAALAAAERLVAEGNRAMTALLARIPVVWLDPAVAGGGDVRCPTPLLDVDTPEDLAALQRAMRP
jgi:molybdopterin-guanine dinucleotide biosynthesis protein A